MLGNCYSTSGAAAAIAVAACAGLLDKKQLAFLHLGDPPLLLPFLPLLVGCALVALLVDTEHAGLRVRTHGGTDAPGNGG